MLYITTSDSTAFKLISNPKEYYSSWNLVRVNVKNNISDFEFLGKIQRLVIPENTIGLLLSNDVYLCGYHSTNVRLDCFWFLVRDEQLYIPTSRIVPCSKTTTEK